MAMSDVDRRILKEAEEYIKDVEEKLGVDKRILKEAENYIRTVEERLARQQKRIRGQHVETRKIRKMQFGKMQIAKTVPKGEAKCKKTIFSSSDHVRLAEGIPRDF